MEIGVGRWANKAREQGYQYPKLLNGSGNVINSSGFVLIVVGKQKLDCFVVRFA